MTLLRKIYNIENILYLKKKFKIKEGQVCPLLMKLLLDLNQEVDPI